MVTQAEIDEWDRDENLAWTDHDDRLAEDEDFSAEDETEE